MPRENVSGKRKYFVWTNKATECLVETWESHLGDFLGQRKKTKIHKDMAEAMSEFGVTSSEVKAKLQVMTKRYRKEALQVSKTKTRSKWSYFSRLRNLLENDDFDDLGKECEEMENTERSDGSVDSDNESAESSTEFEFPEPTFRPDLDTNVEDKIIVHGGPLYHRRARDIAEEKLAIQRETLNVMRSMAKDLSNLHATFLDVYKKSHPKRSL